MLLSFNNQGKIIKGISLLGFAFVEECLDYFIILYVFRGMFRPIEK